MDSVIKGLTGQFLSPEERTGLEAPLLSVLLQQRQPMMTKIFDLNSQKFNQQFTTKKQDCLWYLQTEFKPQPKIFAFYSWLSAL